MRGRWIPPSFYLSPWWIPVLIAEFHVFKELQPHKKQKKAPSRLCPLQNKFHSTVDKIILPEDVKKACCNQCSDSIVYLCITWHSMGIVSGKEGLHHMRPNKVPVISNTFPHNAGEVQFAVAECFPNFKMHERQLPEFPSQVHLS